MRRKERIKDTIIEGEHLVTKQKRYIHLELFPCIYICRTVEKGIQRRDINGRATDFNVILKEILQGGGDTLQMKIKRSMKN